MPNYRRYQEALISAGRGTPLWEHSAENDCKPIRIGDIGYLRFGLFIRIFNATLPSGDLDNEFGEPSGYTPLTSIAVRCTEKDGAIVVSESDVESEDVVQSDVFTDYISQHAHSWADFIDNIGRDVALHQLIFVTGPYTHLTPPQLVILTMVYGGRQRPQQAEIVSSSGDLNFWIVT
ncbi:hypothetical protein Clacol_000264 [Clathrus columnatus]|uniref:Uncharacterized protein n=1 Tax=Clathrus columnatus TaxID=1419009 RepID=A0AAV4ZWV6_9AGAM|nr:hypothetical protein Clacol_000264 [Clathrus columnatus]